MTDKEIIEMERDLVTTNTRTTIGAAVAVCSAAIWVAFFLGSKLSSIEVALLALNDRIALVEQVVIDKRIRHMRQEVLIKDKESP